MSIRVNKLLHNSFVLDEPELRRIHQVLIEQVTQAAQNDDISTTFILKLKNQMSLDKTSLDEILAESNGGVHAIQELTIEISSKSSSIKISLKFSKDNFSSIFYSIYGNDRSWVTITQSIIEERIRNIKRPLILSGINRFILLWFTIVITSGTIFGVINLFLDRLANIPHSGGIAVTAKDVIVFLIGIILLAVGVLSYLVFFPPQNFYWEDYTKIYQRRQSIGKFILIVMLIGIVLNVFGSAVASFILSK